MSKSLSDLTVTDTGLQLAGPLQFDTVSALLEIAEKELDQVKLDTVVIDMEKVNRIDSAGVSLLLEWKRQLQAKNKSFVIKGMQDQVLSLLKTYRLQSLFS